jgi:hypothetical protein
MAKILTADNVLIDTTNYDFDVTSDDCDAPDVVVVRGWNIHLDSNAMGVEPVFVFGGTKAQCYAYMRKLAVLDGAYEYINGSFVRITASKENHDG